MESLNSESELVEVIAEGQPRMPIHDPLALVPEHRQIQRISPNVMDALNLQYGQEGIKNRMWWTGVGEPEVMLRMGETLRAQMELSLTGQIRELKYDMNTLKATSRELKYDVNTLKATIDTLQTELRRISNGVFFANSFLLEALWRRSKVRWGLDNKGMKSFP